MAIDWAGTEKIPALIKSDKDHAAFYRGKDANHEKRQEPFVFPYLIGVAKTGET
jgi:hypothetical protein